MEPHPAPKPINVFYVWYSELCRRLNCSPAPVVKPAKPKSTTVLDFVADRLKVSDWTPLVQALRTDTSLHVIRIRSRASDCPFLSDVDSETKAKSMKRRFGAIRTDHVLRTLLRSISASARISEVLTCLELDGLYLSEQYLEPLLQALRKNKTVKNLSFANSGIGDSGCQMVCTYARFAPNLEVLNLEGCKLSRRSGEHLGKLIKHQQINRYCESWHNSLRYENPISEAMRGLKRITVNSNRELGDDGMVAVLCELEDDLWVKALDAQRCGITDSISDKILQVVRCNKSLEILDLRQNERLDMGVLEKILQVLRERQYHSQPEYQWCSTSLSLTWNSVRDSGSRSSFGTVHKTQSAPVRGPQAIPARKTKTTSSFQQDAKLQDAKIQELNCKLRLETAKRREMERRNEMLKREMDKIKGESDRYLRKTAGDRALRPKRPQQVDRIVAAAKPNGHTNGHTRNGRSTNGFTADARRIFEDLLRRRTQPDEPEDEEPDEELLDYFLLRGTSTATLTKGDEASGEVSLCELVRELKRAAPAKSTR